MKKHIYILFLILPLLGLSQDHIWHKTFGGTKNEFSLNFTIDNQGSQFRIGTFKDTVDFDPNAGVYYLYSHSQEDRDEAFIQKLDSSGNLVWAKSLQSNPTNSYSRGVSICLDLFGDIIIVGTFDGTVDVDPGLGVFNLTSTGGNGGDIFIVKLNPNGDFIWAKRVGNNTMETVTNVNSDINGDIYMAGGFHNTMDFDPGPGTYNLTGTADGFLLKLDTAGNFLWAIAQGGWGSEFIGTISFDNLNNIYLSGSFKSPTDFDPGIGTYILNVSSTTDAFIQKLTPNGNLLWVHQFPTYDQKTTHELDRNGNVYIVGSFWNSCDFNPGSGVNSITSNGLADIYVVKLDSGGNFKWVKSFGGIDSEQYSTITINDKGSVFINASINGVADFDPGPAIQNTQNYGSLNAIIAKLDTNGQFYWVRSFGAILAFSVCDDDYIYMTGFFENTVDFDLESGIDTSTSIGMRDIFAIKLGIDSCNDILLGYDSISPVTCVDSGYIKVNAFNTSPAYSYSWNTIPVTNGSETVFGSQNPFICTVIDGNGCSKSFNTFINNQYLNSVDSATICLGDSIFLGGSFQFDSGIYSDTLQTQLICDSIYSVNLMVYPSYIFTQTQSICQNDSLLIYGTYQNTVGTYYDSLQTILGCDSTFSTTLTISPVFTSSQNQSICQGDSLLIYGVYQNTSGTYYDSLQTINSCDSILSTALTVNPLPSVSIASFNPDTLCDNGAPVALPVGSPGGGNYTGTGVSGGNFDPVAAGIGTYDVIYTYTDGNTCINSDTTIITIVSCVGIDEVSNDFGILIYPNPNTGQFTIEKPNGLNKEVKIKLLDATSKLILEKLIPIDQQKIDMDITEYSKGIYYLQLIVDEEVFVKQILKN